MRTWPARVDGRCWLFLLVFGLFVGLVADYALYLVLEFIPPPLHVPSMAAARSQGDGTPHFAGEIAATTPPALVGCITHAARHVWFGGSDRLRVGSHFRFLRGQHLLVAFGHGGCRTYWLPSGTVGAWSLHARLLGGGPLMIKDLPWLPSAGGWCLMHSPQAYHKSFANVVLACWSNEEEEEELKGDREIVLAAVSKNGGALQFAAEELKGDREIVLAAVSKDGCSLNHATNGLKADEEMMRHALEQSPDQLVGLKVSLLCGRCCSEIFSTWDLVLDRKTLVLRSCAASLELDRDLVERTGTFLCGPLKSKIFVSWSLAKCMS